VDIKSLFKRKPVSQILAQPAEEGHGTLNRNLNVRDLTAFGIAAVIGGGIFSSIGQVLGAGGPGASLLYVFTAIVCLFSALCYAQFASSIPVAGSAYTYSYAVFGELIAWIIGWDLLMEYAIGNIAVAISWSDYFTGLWNGFAGASFQFPAWLSMDYVSASKGFTAVNEMVAMPNVLPDPYLAWVNAPQLFGIRIIADLPALFIVVAITWLVFVGIKESKRASNIFVLIKLAIIFLVIVAGAFYVKPENWSPFAPNGVGGILKGISGVFFAYIGFDAISTTAEECEKPERDLPRSMIYSLLICTVIYVLVTLVLSGMVNYKEIGGGDPMASAFRNIGIATGDGFANALSGIIAVGAVVAMASVFLVFQIGQPRIWMSMSRDGLLPKVFSKIHPKYKTPSFSTILTGVMVGVPALFLNLQEVIDLTSIGTLFAFALVSAGVLLMDKYNPDVKPKFRVPYLSSRIFIPILVGAVVLIFAVTGYFNTLTTGISDYAAYLGTLTEPENPTATAFEVFRHKLPEYLFLVIAVVILIYAFGRNYSLLPILALISNLFLMSQLGHTNWERFFIWLGIGLVLYFAYGYSHSKLRMANNAAKAK
jgi:basic amino acid/polyamine antiporter, APA family